MKFYLSVTEATIATIILRISQQRNFKVQTAGKVIIANFSDEF